MSKELTSKNNHAILRNDQLSHTISNRYLIAATSPNTRRAYQSDIRHFEQWGTTT